jgi:hypothetical protein
LLVAVAHKDATTIGKCRHRQQDTKRCNQIHSTYWCKPFLSRLKEVRWNSIPYLGSGARMQALSKPCDQLRVLSNSNAGSSRQIYPHVAQLKVSEASQKCLVAAPPLEPRAGCHSAPATLLPRSWCLIAGCRGFPLGNASVLPTPNGTTAPLLSHPKAC